MADQQPRGDLRMGEGRRVVDAVEADAACNIRSGTGKVQHAFAAEAETDRGGAAFVRFVERFQQRSEEHTSELQSLMRISYAVFCLKKKNQKNTHKKTSNCKATQLYGKHDHI